MESTKSKDQEKISKMKRIFVWMFVFVIDKLPIWSCRHLQYSSAKLKIYETMGNDVFIYGSYGCKIDIIIRKELMPKHLIIKAIKRKEYFR